MDAPVFQYRRIGKHFVANLTQLIADKAESAVVVGPRYGGKRYLIQRVHEQLQQENGPNPIILVKFFGDDSLTTLASAARAIAEAVAAEHGNSYLDQSKSGDLFEPKKGRLKLLE